MLLEGLRRLGREGRVGAAPRRELLEPAPRPQPDERGAHLPRAEEREQQLIEERRKRRAAIAAKHRQDKDEATKEQGGDGDGEEAPNKVARVE